MSGQPQPAPRRAGGARPDFRHPDEVLEFIDGIRQATRRAAGRHAELAARAGELTGTGYSDDGSVHARVDAAGVVSFIDIHDSALRRGGHLAQLILTAIRQAQAARAIRLAELGTELGGGPGTAPAGERVDALVREAIPEHVRETLQQRGGSRG